MKTTFILIVSLLMFACSNGHWKGFKTGNKKYMEEFESELTIKNIPFTKGSDGMIHYKNSSEIENIHRAVNNKTYYFTPIKLSSPEARTYFKKLLTSKNIEFYEIKKEDGIWINWHPKNNLQKDELESKVMHHMLKLKRESY